MMAGCNEAFSRRGGLRLRQLKRVSLNGHLTERSLPGCFALTRGRSYEQPDTSFIWFFSMGIVILYCLACFIVSKLSRLNTPDIRRPIR